MKITQRARRRILLLLAAVVLVAAGVIALRGLRTASQARLAQESREEGLAAYKDGDYETALSKLGYAVSHDKSDLEALLAFADCRKLVPERNRQHLIKAIAYYNAALRVESESPEALAALIELYRNVGYRPEADEIADRILALSPDDVDALAVKAEIAFFDERYDEAIERYERLSDQEPQKLEWRYGHIQALEAVNTPPTAILELCDQWIERHEQDGRFRLLKTHILADFGEVAAAKAQIAEAIGLETSSPEILQAMLSALDALDMRNEAEELLDRAKSAAPGQSWVYEAAARRLWQSFRYEDALAELDEAETALGELDTRLLCWKGLVLAERGDLESAADAVRAIGAKAQQTEVNDRQAAEAWSAAINARLHATRAEWVEAFNAHNLSVMLAPDDPILQFLRAQAYQRIGEHESALVVLRNLASTQARWTSLNVALAESLLAVGQPSEAFETVKGIVKQAPESGANIYLLLCRAWLALGPVGDAIGMTDSDGREFDLLGLLQSIHSQVGWHVRGTPMLLEVYRQRGLTEKAASLLDDAAAEEDLEINVLLALAEASSEWDAQRALALVDAAESRTGASAEVVMAHATLLLRAGEAEEAIAALNDALASKTSDHEQHAQLELMRAQVLLESARDDTSPDVLRIIEESGSPRVVLAILAREATWNHQTIVRSALDRLNHLLGEESLRIRLEEARYLWRFESEDPAAIARAQAMVHDVLRADPDSRAALTLMASLQLMGGESQTANAIQNLRRALDHYPAEAKLYPHLVRLLQQQGDFGTASDYLARMTQHVGKDLDLCRVEIELLEAQGEYDRAIERLRTLLELESSEADSLHFASLLSRTGRAAEADKIYTRLLNQPGLSEEVVVAAAFHLARIGQVQEGQALLESGLSGRDESVRSLQLGRFLLRQGLYEEAEHHLSAALKLDPDSARVREELTNLYAISGDLVEAMRYAVEGLALEPQNRGLRRAIVAIAISLDEPSRSDLISDPHFSTSDDPVFMQVLNLCGRSTDPSDSDLNEAQRLVEKHPQRPEVWLIAISLHAQAGKWVEAIRLAKRGSARLPTDPTPAQIATRLLTQVGRHEEALDVARVWRQRTLDAPFQADTTIAALLLDLDRPVEAVHQLAIYADHLWARRARYPAHLEIRLGALIQAGNLDEAGRLIPALLEETEQWRKTLLDMTQKLDEQPARALLQILEPYLSEDPSDRLQLAIAWTNLASRFSSYSIYERADALARSIEDDPELLFTATALRANIALGLGELETAEMLYRDLYAQRNDDVLVLNNLAYILARRGEQCEEAALLAQRAVSLTNGEVETLNTLAQALLCAGFPDEAEKRIRAALAKQPSEPSCLVTLAAIHFERGNVGEARAELADAQRILQSTSTLDPDLLRRVEQLSKTLESESPAGSGLDG